VKDERDPEIEKFRPTRYPVNPILYNRWSHRAMSGEELKEEEFMPLFEAARLAPSSYNGQPWKFLYAKRNTPTWDLFYNLMIDFNKGWTKNAALIAVVISRNTFEHNNKPERTHSYDTGAAWMSLAIEGESRGLVVHGMEGFDYDKARKDLEIPDGYTVEAMFAVGKKAPKENLPEELRKRENPSPRKPLEEVAVMGKFKKS
jgi:nitroreductase